MGDGNKVEIRFKNLPSLLNDMKAKKYIIDSFPFQYKGENYIVILTIYKEKERKPKKFSQAKVEFVKLDNPTESVTGWVDFFEVSFNSKDEFCEFFGIVKGDANRNLFVDFSEIFSDFIPVQKIIKKTGIERLILGGRAEGGNPNAIYCFDVRRNGVTNGVNNERSVENSNKAETLCKDIYDRYKVDKNLSFFFSDNPDDERDLTQIMKLVASRGLTY